MTCPKCHHSIAPGRFELDADNRLVCRECYLADVPKEHIDAALVGIVLAPRQDRAENGCDIVFGVPCNIQYQTRDRGNGHKERGRLNGVLTGDIDTWGKYAINCDDGVSRYLFCDEFVSIHPQGRGKRQWTH